MEYHSVLEKFLAQATKQSGNSKYILLGERSQSEINSYYMILVVWHSRIAKNINIIISGCQRLREGRRMKQRWFSGQKITIKYHNVYMALYICQSTLNLIAQRVNLNVCSLKNNLSRIPGRNTDCDKRICITNLWDNLTEGSRWNWSWRK